MRKALTIVAIVLGFIGAILGILAAWRIEQIFTANSLKLGYRKTYDTWFWNHSLLLSFSFVGLAFVCEFAAVLVDGERER